MRRLFSEKTIGELFTISLWLKGIHGMFELAGGFILLFVSGTWLTSVMENLAAGELDEDPGSIVAHYFEHLSQTLTQGAQSFAAWYLLIHGAVKLVLIAGLLKRKLWMYPIAMIVFALFVFYQMERYMKTHSFLLIAISVVDVAVILLTWHEYARAKHMLKRGEFL